jgi:hypothetical protein
LGFVAGEVGDVGDDEFAELRVLLMDRAAADGEDLGDAGIEEAFAKDALPDHACSSGEDDSHRGILPDAI